MSAAYTPGLQVTERTLYRARRVLPIEGHVLVEPGEPVNARQVIAKAELPGEVIPINLANHLSVSPADVPGCLLAVGKQVGDRVEPGEVLARTGGIFGFFKAEYRTRAVGVIETVSNVTGQVLLRGTSIPVERTAYLSGTVSEVLPRQGAVIEAEVAFLQGIFGVGGEAFGPIRIATASPAQSLTADCIEPGMAGAVVIGGGRVTGDAIRRAIELGLAAVVAGGIDDADLREVLGYDLGVAITGTEQLGTTLIITEGFGEIAMAQRTFELLKSFEGQEAAVNGATQIRAGVMRPEIVIPLAAGGGSSATNGSAEPQVASLERGATVRVIRDPYFGRIGTVSALPAAPQVLESGSKARVLDVSCDSGETLRVPRANVEIIGGA
jgi:hypothetical protein